MANTIDIRRRIRSVKNTQQITRAMKMVAAARLRRAQDRIIAARPYSAALKLVLASVASRVSSNDHPLLQTRDEKKVLLLVVTGDKGLAGAFNTNVLKVAQNTIQERGWNDLQLIPIGRKANDFFKRRSIPIRHQAVNIFQALNPEHGRELAKIITDDFISGEVDAVYIVFNEFRSVISQIVTVERILPLERPPENLAAPAIEYLYEPEPDKILSELLPRHIEFQVYRSLLDSAAAEHGARMTAMDAATRNAGDLIESLTLSYNRIRQASITREIIEIVSGAQALD